jgi:hypothetical protein
MKAAFARLSLIGRWLIWIQGLRCAYCQLYCPEHYGVDHAIPVARGGTDDIENLFAACRSCNTSKGTLTPLQFWLRMRARYGPEWQFGWASGYERQRPSFHRRKNAKPAASVN